MHSYLHPLQRTKQHTTSTTCPWEILECLLRYKTTDTCTPTRLLTVISVCHHPGEDDGASSDGSGSLRRILSRSERSCTPGNHHIPVDVLTT